MKMFRKKINQKDLKELSKRTELIKQHILISQALEIQKQVWLKNILPKYNLDLNKDYDIDLKTGAVKEVKPKK